MINEIITVVVSIGGAVAAVAALENYLGEKFVRSIRAVIDELKIPDRLDALDRELREISQRGQERIVALEQETERSRRAQINSHAQITALIARVSRAETAIRVLGGKADDRSISTILDSSEGL